MSRLSAMSVLAMAFSLIFACNLAFFRHLRLAYVPNAGRNGVRWSGSDRRR
jgi:hypothetical protein